MAQKNKKPTSKGKRAKSRTKKERQKKMAVGLVAGLMVLMMLSTLLVIPGVQDVLFEQTGIAQQQADANNVPLEELWPGDIPDMQEYLSEIRGGEQAAATAEPDMTAAVHFLDVGQGDAVLMESGGEYALLDAGPTEGVDNLMGYLSYLEIDSLKYLIMSHPHEDHIGGMQAVLEYVPVEQILLPDFEKAPYPTTSTFEAVLQATLERNIPASTMKTGDSYSLGNGEIEVLADGVENDGNYNLLSPMLLFETGDLRFLSSGDAEKANETAALESGASLQANLYKAAHHGSSTSNSEAFMEEVRPWLTVISCGQDNMYGHPHREALERFEALESGILRTDVDGFIRVSPDGEGGLQAATTTPRGEQQQAA